MNIVTSGIEKFWWKGIYNMPAMECGSGGTNMACKDAVSKYLFIIQDYIL